MRLFNAASMMRRCIVVGVVFVIGNQLTADLDGPWPTSSDPEAAVVAGAPPGAQAAVVDRAVDGDTVRVTPVSDGPLPQGVSVTVRLIGIDTPETKRPGAPVACGGPAASAFTARLLTQGTQVVVVPDVEDTDRYGRALRYVYVEHGMVNLKIVRAGYARELTVAPNRAHHRAFGAAAARAQRQHRGMWATCSDPFAPLS